MPEPAPSRKESGRSGPSVRKSSTQVEPKLGSKEQPQIAHQKVPPTSIETKVEQQPKEIQTTNQPQNKNPTWLAWNAKSTDVKLDTQEAVKPMVEPAKPQNKPVDDATPATTSKPKGNTEVTPLTNKRTWLQMWGGDSPQLKPQDDAAEDNQLPHQPNKSKNLDIPQTPKANTSSQASSIETSPPPPLPGDASKSSGWVFWSRDRNSNLSKSSNEHQPHVGEIAISGESSQARPKRASISLTSTEKRPEVRKPPPAPTGASKTDTTKLESRPETPKLGQKGKTPKVESANAAATVVHAPTDTDSPRTASPAPSTRRTDDLLLPPLSETLHLHEGPSLLQQLSRMLYYTSEPELKHLSLVRDPPRIRNALAIGVHGYFPGPMVRTLLGQPTGTSIKFADMASKSIRKWTNSRGYDCQVKTAALEGEGKIAERVELLWKLLLNWIDEIRRSDFVMVACHSQGVPVAIMLVAKLIRFGCVNAARVGICAMAGVNLGPFVDFRSRWISGSAGELFEFSDPDSKVSQEYQRALDIVLKAGVRLSLIGSIDDQLVSLESSIFAPISHPHIYRAVSIDSRLHAPNFLSHLVGFVLKLRNLGVQDHGLIRELSSPLAGSLYTGEGHSRIYDDEAVYDLAVSFALETSTLANVALARRQPAASVANPYLLPFAMRGILEEDFVKTQLQEEAQQLLTQFDDWRPTTKVLKDVKFRLEGVRSKL